LTWDLGGNLVSVGPQAFSYGLLYCVPNDNGNSLPPFVNPVNPAITAGTRQGWTPYLAE